jgi:hypothetical protein
MELQESTIRNIHLFAAFARTPVLADRRGALVQALQDALEVDDWVIDNDDGPSVSVHGSSPESVVGVDEDNLLLSVDDPDSLEFAQTFAQTGVRAIADVLQIEGFVYIGAAAIAIAPADSFEELTLWLADRLGPPPRLRAAFGDNPTNGWWRLNWEHEERSYFVEVGPLSADSRKAETAFIDAEALELPANSLYIDVRRSIEGSDASDVDEAIELSRTALSDAWTALARFDDSLREI